MKNSKNSLKDWQETQDFGEKLPMKQRLDYIPEISINENYERNRNEY